MKCKIIDNQMGGLVCFFSRDFEETNTLSDIAKTDASYTKVVFLDDVDESILPYLSSYFPGKVDICFCNPNATGFNEAIELRHSNQIRDVFVTPNCIYANSQLDWCLGYESWDNVWSPDALHQYDISAHRVSDIDDLIATASQIAESIAASNPVSDLEKIILVDAWIQRNIQYATGKESVADGGVYICESIDNDSNVHDPFIHGYGRCEDIALSAALILNHPSLGIHCRQAGASRTDNFNHSWNIVLCSGKEYYVDFTHNITRNPHKATGALRAVSYSYQFTLLGVNDAAKKYGTTEFYGSKVISSHSLDRNEIEAAARSLEKRGVLETHWNPNPIIPSVFIING